MAISSPGIGSGIDVQSIVSQLVALERAPLTNLQTQASAITTRISTYSTIKSQFAALGDAAAKLSTTSAWGVYTATSSNTSAVSVTAGTTAAPGGLSIEVQQLAKAQSTASVAVANDTPMGSGTLSIEVGGWSGGTFTGNGSPVNVSVGASDTLSTIAGKINQAGAGVTATVLRDASGERLLVRSKDTGEEQAFRIQVSDDDGNNADASGLSRLAYDPGTATGGMSLTQGALNAQATINNVAITSASNKLTDTLPGLTITLSQVTTEPVELEVKTDTEEIKKRLQAFVDAYNTINDTLSNAVKYDADSKTAGPLQGDGTTVGLQNALRSMMRSVTGSTPFSRLLDVGISTESSTGAKLKIDTTKLDEAINGNLEGLQSLFTADNADATLRGFGVKVKAFTDGLLASDGQISTKTDALAKQKTRNQDEQDRVNDRADRAQTRLLAQFSSLDTTVAQYSALGSFVSQQLALWSSSS
ncbi:MAG: flagellar filament capping protein FliD [Hydrogenophaga sp.]|uniref:flagellar filament capping protein FliD n=1 Tax=Hydrogenophaga sp. TaxID=1904254 RepID=UPI001D6C425B|nr:flagellar filament capping protein FliD [Hydrogenophaga sp.]MBX3609687.1 flagellar filament capping protein FliD [Hydrogenophaga sp.]